MDTSKKRESNESDRESGSVGGGGKSAGVRKLAISNFRNVGITYDGDDKPAELVLNRSLEEGSLGDLVFLVGPNNSGKSNVLAALEAFWRGETEKKDVPDFTYRSYEPDIRMRVELGNGRNYEKLLCQNYAPTYNEYETENREEEILEGLKKERDRLKSEMDKLRVEELDEENFSILTRYLGLDLASMNTDDLYPIRWRFTSPKLKGIAERYITFREHEDARNKLDAVERKISEIEFDASLKTEKIGRQAPITGDDKPECSFLDSRIVTYSQKPVSDSDLSCEPESPTDFIKGILRIMGKDPDTLRNLYQRWDPKIQNAHLKKYARILNKELHEKITDLFNKMYHCKKGEEYRFEFEMQSDRTYFYLFRGDMSFDLSKQSTGFRWFFDFFFNFVFKEDLKPGDIVLMDEPATNIHVRGQIELRKFLKDLAVNNGFTFVISTHSPFLVSCDHLDELRLMVRDDGGRICIKNRFNSMDGDTLSPILDGLTVGRHILVGPKQKVIFTEGITDYNYLTAFKLLFSEEDPKYRLLVFLPVNGLGKEGDEKFRQGLLNTLSKMDRPTLLVDDDGAGKDFAEIAKGTNVTVVPLSEMSGKSGHVIESLFTAEDRKKFRIDDKSWNGSSVFKKSILSNSGSLSDTTKKRFRETLDRLLDV
ncbi:MAG: AAA family ATPase [Candidatus Methanoplasma sp.]|jgi:predicted ATP-dependent endonuclease of OLD family|nr:AAA family ATPase [Candidatus Methanoplasma sp.]